MRYIPAGVLWNAAKKMDGRGCTETKPIKQQSVICSVLSSSPLHLPAIDHITLRAQKSAKKAAGWGSLKPQLFSLRMKYHNWPSMLYLICICVTLTEEEREELVKQPTASLCFLTLLFPPHRFLVLVIKVCVNV